MTVTDMTPGHAEAVAALEERIAPVPWSLAAFHQELANPLAVYKVAILDDRVVGYTGLWHIVNEGHINNLAVDGAFRQMGIGSRLLDALFDVARTREMIGLTLEVRMHNLVAQRLYFKYGFKAEGIRKNYYKETGEDAIIMWKYF